MLEPGRSAFGVGLPSPVFVGFFPITPVPPPATLDLPGVELICSVSHCICEVPDGWVDRWRHNDLGFYDTREAADEVASAGGGSFESFGYRVYPLVVDDSEVADFSAPVSPPEQLDGFERLGIDVVTRSAGYLFECSPLSCNWGARHFRVNRFCLFDELDEALDASMAMASGGYEPGPYHLVEVWRPTSVLQGGRRPG